MRGVVPSPIYTPRSQTGTAGSHHCLRCGWRWNSQLRNPQPKSCAFCGSRMWNIAPEESELCAACQLHAVGHSADGIFWCAAGHRWERHRRTSIPEDSKWLTWRNTLLSRRRERLQKQVAKAVELLGRDTVLALVDPASVDTVAMAAIAGVQPPPMIDIKEER